MRPRIKPEVIPESMLQELTDVGGLAFGSRIGDCHAGQDVM
jgi:hypothetical protein